jgi:hypothetical protein
MDTIGIILILAIVICFASAVWCFLSDDFDEGQFRQEQQQLRQMVETLSRINREQSSLNQSAHEARAELIRAACEQTARQAREENSRFKKGD